MVCRWRGYGKIVLLQSFKASLDKNSKMSDRRKDGQMDRVTKSLPELLIAVKNLPYSFPHGLLAKQGDVGKVPQFFRQN